jgi:hypothetical protein
MGNWLIYAGMFLFGSFVVFMCLMVILASFVRIYRAVDSAAWPEPNEDLSSPGLNVPLVACHSGMTQAGEKTYDDVARAGVGGRPMRAASVPVE